MSSHKVVISWRGGDAVFNLACLDPLHCDIENRGCQLDGWWQEQGISLASDEMPTVHVPVDIKWTADLPALVAPEVTGMPLDLGVRALGALVAFAPDATIESLHEEILQLREALDLLDAIAARTR